MTGIKTGSPVRRETACTYRGRPIMVELHPGYMSLREKGRRFSVAVDYRTALEIGYKILHRQAMAEKKASRKKGGRK